MALQFEWHDRKAAANLRKHGISFEEAATIFGDPLSITITDERHSRPNDERFVTIGSSIRNQLIVVIHLEHEMRIRIISARRATSRERKQYESR
jgi:uncharacterized protein